MGDIDGAIESYHQALSRKLDDPFSSEMLNRALHEAVDTPDPLLQGHDDGFNNEQKHTRRESRFSQQLSNSSPGPRLAQGMDGMNNTSNDSERFNDHLSLSSSSPQTHHSRTLRREQLMMTGESRSMNTAVRMTGEDDGVIDETIHSIFTLDSANTDVSMN